MAVDRTLVQAVQAHQAGRLDEAEKLYRSLLRRRPRESLALENLGVILHGRGEWDEAGKLLRRALAINPKSSEAHNNLGNVLRAQGELDAAIAAYRQAIRLKPNEFAHNNLGNALRAKGALAEAVESYRQAVAIQPGYADAWYNMALCWRAGGQTAEAVACYEQALARRPHFPEALSNLGTCLTDLGRREEAVLRLRQALQMAPGFAEAWNNLGIVLKQVGDVPGAVAAYREAVRLKPGFVDAILNLGTLLAEEGQRREAIALFEQVAGALPEDPLPWGKLSFEMRHVCDWRDFDMVDAKLRGFVRAGTAQLTAFAVITLDSTPEEQQMIARSIMQRMTAVAGIAPLPPRPAGRRDKIRLGYLSADFHDHATAYLMAELFERHDRARFETFAYSIGPDSDSEIRRRLVAGFDHFADLRMLSHAEAAQAIRADGIDILVDLKGHTQNARPEIAACRPAPVQAHYVGYPGTMGAAFIDYVIADRFIIPPDRQRWYDEKVVALPHCYQPNDTRRAIADWTPTRTECGLPEKGPDGEGFVFCSFNSLYKLTPRLFDIWMRLLLQVPGSVLWLLQSDATATGNLKREAQARGVDPARLVFAPMLQLPFHLARQRLADLFLDTLPVNAHTTASDALWAGLPVLTCAGDSFIGRVAGSLLHAIGLPELVTTSLADYEAMALGLARDPARLAALRQRLAANRPTALLFDIARLTRNLERGYEMMWERHLAGKAPDHIAVVE